MGVLFRLKGLDSEAKKDGDAVPPGDPLASPLATGVWLNCDLCQAPDHAALQGSNQSPAFSGAP